MVGKEAYPEFGTPAYSQILELPVKSCPVLTLHFDLLVFILDKFVKALLFFVDKELALSVELLHTHIY